MNPPTDYAHDLRLQAERRRLEVEKERAQALQEQSSNKNPPDVRVRIWEKLHQLHLSRVSSIRIVALVARQTGLEPAEVQAVLHQRLVPACG